MAVKRPLGCVSVKLFILVDDIAEHQIWKSDFENCWDSCGKKGGSCQSAICSGFCCSATQSDNNLYCPASAVAFLKSNFPENTHDQHIHVCVEIVPFVPTTTGY